MPALQSVGICDMNPLTRSLLVSSDGITSFKILALKMMIVILSAALGSLGYVQVLPSLSASGCNVLTASAYAPWWLLSLYLNNHIDAHYLVLGLVDYT